ncbi:MAG: hypothetical protein ABI175_20445 [Polyangiales bacterium]
MRSLSRSLDIREGEGALVAGAFAVLLLVIVAHSMLETARDALFLAKLPVRQLTFVYVGVAALAVLVGPMSTALVRRVGGGRALAISLLVAAGLTGGLFLVRSHGRAVVALYLTSGLLGAVLVPQFWALVEGSLTVAQARRLFTPIATAGVIGGVIGSGAAALLVDVIPVSGLLLVASGILASTGLATLLAPRGERAPETRVASGLSVFREEPLLRHIGVLVVLSTASLLVLDYVFKMRVARDVPAAELGRFFARFYTGLNALSIVIQVFIGGALIRRMGVVGAVGFTPFFLLFGSLGILFTGGALLAVLAAKATDGGLRYGVHRVSTELLYLPISAPARERAKPLLDGAIARGTQALTALALLGLGALGLNGGRFVTFVLAFLVASWLAVAIAVRAPYLALFRRALATGAITSQGGVGLDLNSAEVLIEKLASLDPTQVIAAMDVLDRRGRAGLIPALVLYHTEATVLRRALEIFTGTERNDWAPLGQRLLRHESEEVRQAALRALVTHGATEAVEQVAEDWSPRSRAYAGVCLAAREERDDVMRHARVQKLLTEDDDAVRAGMLLAIADLGAPPSTRPLLTALTKEPAVGRSAELVSLLAAAIARSGDGRMIPWLVGRLERGDGRIAVRAALVSLGQPACAAVEAALADETLPRRLRAHLPHALAMFGTQRAADVLFARLVAEPDGLVRYKALRGLARIAADRREVRISRRKLEELAYGNVVEHLRLLAMHAFVAEEQDEPTSRLLRGLLEDKLRQSLERVFRLLKIAHRDEDLHRVHQATLGADKRQRANAAEFLDTLLSRRDQREMHAALRIVIDDLPAKERVARAAFALPSPPRSRAEAITALIGDADLVVATLATEYAVRHGDHALVAAARRARSANPELLASGQRYFNVPKVDPGHA